MGGRVSRHDRMTERGAHLRAPRALLFPLCAGEKSHRLLMRYLSLSKPTLEQTRRVIRVDEAFFDCQSRAVALIFM